MKIDTQIQEDNQAKLTVEFDSDQLESAKRKAAHKIAQRIKIPGFRPGKAPYPVILRTVREAEILDEALEILVNEQYPKIIEESGVKSYGPGNLEKIEKLDPPTLIFQVPLEPTATLGDYRSLKFPYELKTITDEDVEKAIEDLRDRSAIQEPANRPAQVGDDVSIRISAERKKVEEGQSLTLIRDHSTSVVIKSKDDNQEREWPFPGFSQHLISLNIGDEKSIDYTYPEDAKAESLRGREAIFRFVVENIEVRKLPELNDEFAKSFGEFESFDAFRKQIRENLERQAKSEYDESYNEQIIEAIVKDSQIKFPPQMLEREIDSVINQLESRLQQQNLDMQTYLKTRNITEDELRKEMSPIAESRIRRSVALFEVGRLEEIKVDENDLKNETTRTLDTIQRIYKPKEVRKMVTGNFVQNMVSSIAADMLTDRTLERLRAYAKGELSPESQASPETTEKASKPKRKKKNTIETPVPDSAKPEEASTQGSANIEAEKPAKPKRKKKTEELPSHD